MKTFSFLILFTTSLLSAQGEFNQWHFGDGAVLDFNGGTPVASTGSAIFTPEGCASMADALGNLLFYTNGITVWNSNHQPMPNGSGLYGDSSTSQSALILPVAGNADQYYLFTLTAYPDNGHLSYSIADMSLDGGLGDILPGSKNIFVDSGFTEKLVAASAECGLWVLVHERENALFYAYPLDQGASGIGAPVISNVGTPHLSNNSTDAAQGVMKVSPDNERIAVATLTGIVEVLDFNNATGIVSNPILLPVGPDIATYGLCFSPGSQFLYVGEGDETGLTPNAVYQYDLSSGTQEGILASKTLAGNAPSPVALAFDLQTGPDDRIYIVRAGTASLDVIALPDVAGAGCNYISDGVLFSGAVCTFGLPNEPRFSLNTQPPFPDLGNDTVLCAGQSVTLHAPASGTWLWSDGSSGSSLTVTASGTYWLQTGTTPSCTATDAITVTVEDPGAQFSASQLSGCLPLQVTFQATGAAGNTFSWDFGDGSTGSGQFSSHVYTGSGCHDVSLLSTSPAGCTASVTLPGYICGFTAPTASFTFSPSVLEGTAAAVTFTNTSENGVSWAWYFGDQSFSTEPSPVHTYQPSANGYTITLIATNSNGCKDTVRAFIPSSNGPVYYVPNAFTPDGNEFNQVFLPVFTSGFDPYRYTLKIFNRWGQLLFESADYRTGWDGSSTTGTMVPDGVYTWKIYYSPPDTDERTILTGHVVLVR